jgi:prevent-host-death family protein
MKTLEMGAFEAKNKLSSLLDRVAQGQRVVITRRGKPVAALVDPALLEGEREEMTAAAILEGFRAVRGRAHPAGCSLKELVEEGRRV